MKLGFVKLLQLNKLPQKIESFCRRTVYSCCTLWSKERPSNESLINWKGLPAPKKPEKDFWSEKRALFGENDYKDILGDGTYPLRKNVRLGPWWIRGWRGNELQMLIRKRGLVGRDLGPEVKHNMKKRIQFLYKRMNKNKGKWAYKGDR